MSAGSKRSDFEAFVVGYGTETPHRSRRPLSHVNEHRNGFGLCLTRLAG